MIDQITFHYKTKRINFGRPVSLFEDTNTRIFMNIEPDPDLREKYEALNPFSIGTQASTMYSSHAVNTEVTQTKSEDVVHKEGGWPQGIDPTNAPSCKQTRSKLEKKENFIPTLRELTHEAEKTVKLNLSIDIFSDHFQHGDAAQAVADPSMRTLSIFRDRFENRQVSSISWSSESTSSATKRVALCYTPNDISNPNAHYESFIYNLECPSVPETELHPSSPLLCLEYNTKDSNFLVGGMSHGSLSLWDIRQGSLPVWTSAIESSHRGGVYAVRWISSKTAFECVSVSSDGNAMTWDTRSNTSPLEVIQLAPTPESLPEGYAPPFGGRCLDYHTGVPTKYMVGTVEGLVMTVNRKASDPSTRISGVFPGHYGPVYAVRRHPVDTKYFASVSDWCCRFFTEDNKTPLLTIPAQRHYLTNAVWGLSRTTTIFTGNIVGGIDAWDLIQSLKQPVCSINVGLNPIYSMAIESTGQFLLTGDSEGTATLLELNDSLRNITQTEKSLFNGMMGREAKRVKNYDQFIKEQKMREKQKASSTMENEEKGEVAPFDPSQIEREFEAALKGEKENVVEKKRQVIGGDEDEQAQAAAAAAAAAATTTTTEAGSAQSQHNEEEEEEKKKKEESGGSSEKGKLDDAVVGVAAGLIGNADEEKKESSEKTGEGEEKKASSEAEATTSEKSVTDEEKKESSDKPVDGEGKKESSEEVAEAEATERTVTDGEHVSESGKLEGTMNSTAEGLVGESAEKKESSEAAAKSAESEKGSGEEEKKDISESPKLDSTFEKSSNEVVENAEEEESKEEEKEAQNEEKKESSGVPDVEAGSSERAVTGGEHASESGKLEGAMEGIASGLFGNPEAAGDNTEKKESSEAATESAKSEKGGGEEEKKDTSESPNLDSTFEKSSNEVVESAVEEIKESDGEKKDEKEGGGDESPENDAKEESGKGEIEQTVGSLAGGLLGDSPTANE